MIFSKKNLFFPKKVISLYLIYIFIHLKNFLKMKKYSASICLILLYLVSSLSYAQTCTNKDGEKLSSDLEFIENKNQWQPNVLYKTDLHAGVIFLEKNCFTYNLVNVDDIKHSHAHHDYQGNDIIKIVHFHAYKVKFLNSNQDVKINGLQPTPDYCNYFIGKDPLKWASHVRKYKIVEYNNLYKNIDVKVFSKDFYLRYDFIINPGANVKDIVLYYDGVSSIKLDKKGKLIVKTTVNETSELSPYAYQEYEGKQVKVACKYKLRDNKVTFSFPSGYDKTRPLIIDPTLIFSTYSGSTADNWGFTATFDNDDNVYSGGIVHGTGYPVSIGAFQVDFGGGEAYSPTWYQYGWDIGIIKYTPDGTNRLFATYLGGNSSEMPHSLIVNEFNELLILGTTGSNDFPVTPNAYDTTFNGGIYLSYDNVIIFSNGTDIIVSKLSPDGSQLLASTYIGGTANDGLNFRNSYIPFMMHGNDSLYYNYGDGARGEIITDDLNNVYIGTCTFSSDFPVTASSFQNIYSGKQEGVVFKLDYDLSTLVWSSYIGGSEDDAAYSIDVDNNYDIYVAGGTNSSDFPVTAGAYQQNFAGGTVDAFVAHISQNGNNLISSTYFGSSEYDQAYFVRTDRDNNIYITGQTEAPGSTLIYNAIYNTPNSGQFITKFYPSLDSLIWSTVFGTGIGKPNISITAFAVDICNRIYLSGWGREWAGSDSYTWTNTQGTKGMDVTFDAFQDTTDGQDFYVIVLNDDASTLDYATFFGEVHYDACGYSGHDHVDGGTSRFDKKGNIYESMCASCGGCQQTPTYPNPGVWSNTNNSSNCNNAVFKLNINFDFVLADFDIPPVICAPDTINFNNTSVGSGDYIWDFGDGTPTSTEENPDHVYTQSGNYDVTLIVNDNTSCNFTDTIVLQVQVLSDTSYTLPQKDVCYGENIQIGLPPNSDTSVTYIWMPSAGLSSPTVSNPFASPGITTNYLLLVSNGVCTDSIFQTVEIHYLSVFAGNDTTICEGNNILLTAVASESVFSYIWSSSLSFNDTLNFPVSDNTASVNIYDSNTFFIKVNDQYCQAIDSINVNISEVNISTSSDIIICLGDTAVLNVTNQNPLNPLSYNWSPAGSIISGDTTDSPFVKPNSATTYYVTATDSYGCKSTDSVDVDVIVLSVNVNASMVSCYGYSDGQASVSPSGGYTPYLYLWSDGQIEATADSLYAGNYIVTITDFNECKITSMITITQPDSIVLTITDTNHVLCNGENNGYATVDATGGTPGYTYLWIDGQTTQTADSLYAGIYTVTVTDNNSCPSEISIEIQDTSNFNAIVNSTPPSCFGYTDGNATAIASAGTSPYSYLWSNGHTEVNVTDLGAGIYNVTVTESAGCIKNVFFVLTEPEELLVNTDNIQNPTCYGFSDGEATASATGGTSPYSYLWSNGQNSENITGLPQGTYTVTVTDLHNCTTETNVLLTEPSALLLSLFSTNVPCVEVCNGVAISSLSGGTPPYSYLWDDGQTGNTAVDLCEGLHNVTVTDDNLCQITDTITVTDSTTFPYIVATTDDDTIYNGQSTNIHALPLTNYSYSWWPSEGLNSTTIPEPVASPCNTTTYYVTITDQYGCTYLDSVKIIVIDMICDEPYIYVPNAFTPNGDGKNDVLYVRSSVATDIYFIIYNRWGEMVFETRDIDKGWDGTYKGEKCGSGVFDYYLEVTCINEEDYKNKGNITLIR